MKHQFVNLISSVLYHILFVKQLFCKRIRGMAEMMSVQQGISCGQMSAGYLTGDSDPTEPQMTEDGETAALPSVGLCHFHGKIVCIRYSPDDAQFARINSRMIFSNKTVGIQEELEGIQMNKQINQESGMDPDDIANEIESHRR